MTSVVNLDQARALLSKQRAKEKKLLHAVKEVVKTYSDAPDDCLLPAEVKLRELVKQWEEK